MKQTLYAFLSIWVALSSCYFNSPEELLLDAERLSKQEKYGEAIALLDQVIERKPDYLGAYINRGADKSALGLFEEAIWDYKKVIELDPENKLALFNAANNFKRLNEYEEAIELYNQAIGSDGIRFELKAESLFSVPNEAIRFDRGIAHFYADNLEKSFEDLSFAYTKFHERASCHYWLAHIYLRSQQNEEACWHFRKSHEMGNGDAGFEYRKYCEQQK